MTTDRVEGFSELYENIKRAMFTECDYERTTRLIILLAVQLREHETADIWWIGECTQFDLAELIIGAYWHYTEWHGGAALPQNTARSHPWGRSLTRRDDHWPRGSLPELRRGSTPTKAWLTWHSRR